MMNDDPVDDDIWWSIIDDFNSPMKNRYVTGGRMALKEQSKAEEFMERAHGIPLRTFIYYNGKSMDDAYALTYRVLRDSGDNFWHFTGANLLRLFRLAMSDDVVAARIRSLSKTMSVLISELDMTDATGWEWSTIGGFITDFQADNPDGERKLYIVTSSANLQRMAYRVNTAYLHMTNGHDGIVYPYGVG